MLGLLLQTWDTSWQCCHRLSFGSTILRHRSGSGSQQGCTFCHRRGWLMFPREGVPNRQNFLQETTETLITPRVPRGAEPQGPGGLLGSVYDSLSVRSWISFPCGRLSNGQIKLTSQCSCAFCGPQNSRYRNESGQKPKLGRHMV